MSLHSWSLHGLFSDLEYPYASFQCTCITGDQLYSLVWGCVHRLEACGFKVVALTCDGASANRKFIRLHKSPKEEIVYKTMNPYANEDRPVFFISDPSHLIKTVRNCWANSHGHTLKRNLWLNGQDISWQHLVDLYQRHNGSTSSGLSIVHKLKWEHIKLNSYSKMRVNLAAQVLSTTVANAFAYESKPNTKETERFVRTFDRFFDLFNVRSLTEGVHKRKPDLCPYRNDQQSMDRLKWLEKDFINYLDEWEESANGREDLSESEKHKLCLSRETLEGLRFTTKSFVELTRFLLKQSGVQYVLSAKLSQDPLESFFGKQRMRGGYSDNPTVSSFLYGAQSLRVQGSTAVKSTRGNTKRGRSTAALSVDDTPLPKRKRLKSS